VHYSHRDTAAAVTEWLKETAAGEEGVFAKAAKAAKKAVGAEDVKHEEL
jgi:hypothetical protein